MDQRNNGPALFSPRTRALLERGEALKVRAVELINASARSGTNPAGTYTRGAAMRSPSVQRSAEMDGTNGETALFSPLTRELPERGEALRARAAETSAMSREVVESAVSTCARAARAMTIARNAIADRPRRRKETSS
jgi:hypothetical protein